MKVKIVNIDKDNQKPIEVDLTTIPGWDDFYTKNLGVITMLRKKITEHVCKNMINIIKKVDPDNFDTEEINFGGW